jgi:hypothetical protein
VFGLQGDENAFVELIEIGVDMEVVLAIIRLRERIFDGICKGVNLQQIRVIELLSPARGRGLRYVQIAITDGLHGAMEDHLHIVKEAIVTRLSGDLLLLIA